MGVDVRSGEHRGHVRAGAREGGGQAGERQRAEQQSEVAQGDVPVAADEQQVDDDAGEPRGDEVPAEPRADRDDEPGDDLDRADDVHDLVRAAGQVVGDLGREVTVPVDEHVRELVEAEEDRRDGEADAQQPERLDRRVGEVVAARAGRRECGYGSWARCSRGHGCSLSINKCSLLIVAAEPVYVKEIFALECIPNGGEMPEDPTLPKRRRRGMRSAPLRRSASRRAARCTSTWSGTGDWVAARYRGGCRRPRAGHRGTPPRPPRRPTDCSTSTTSAGPVGVAPARGAPRSSTAARVATSMSRCRRARTNWPVGCSPTRPIRRESKASTSRARWTPPRAPKGAGSPTRCAPDCRRRRARPRVGRVVLDALADRGFEPARDRRRHGRAAQLPVPHAGPATHGPDLRDEPLFARRRDRRRRRHGTRREARTGGGILLREAPRKPVMATTRSPGWRSARTRCGPSAPPTPPGGRAR